MVLRLRHSFDFTLLIRLAGRINPEDTENFQDLFKEYQDMPVLLRRLRDNLQFAQKIFEQANQDQLEEE